MYIFDFSEQTDVLWTHHNYFLFYLFLRLSFSLVLTLHFSFECWKLGVFILGYYHRSIDLNIVLNAIYFLLRQEFMFLKYFKFALKRIELWLYWIFQFFFYWKPLNILSHIFWLLIGNMAVKTISILRVDLIFN